MGKNHIYAVIMAGGRGERFWPAGRFSRPKQLLSLVSEKTMLEETVLRLFPLVEPDHVLVITNAAYVDCMREILPIPQENIIGEPAGRDTAPCVALATALIRRKSEDATMILLPADHVIRPAKAFQTTLAAAVEHARNGYLVTLGIPPTYPATGYGYIHSGNPIDDGFCNVLEFKEKPDFETATAFLADGNYFWNSGMFIWRTDVISSAFSKYAPDLAAKLESWTAGSDFTADFVECRKISIDYAIMEHADNVLVGRTDFFWNDIGSWSALKSVMQSDDAGNVIRGRSIVLDSTDNVLISDDDTMLGVIGMHDVAVVKSGNGILVCPLSQEQRVKELVHRIQDEDGTEFL